MFSRFLFLVLIVSSTVLSQFSYSQEAVTKSGGLARVMSMGQNPYIEDPQDIKINAAYGAYYDNFIWGDLGSSKTKWGSDSRSQFFGCNLKVTNGLTIGAILSRSDQISETSISSVDPFYFSVDSSLLHLAPNNSTEIFASFKANNISFGFGLSYIGASSKYTSATGKSGDNDYSFSQLGLNAGIVVNLAKKNRLDCAISMIFPSTKATTTTSTEELSQTLIKADARAFISTGDFQLVPIVTMLLASGTHDYSYTSTSGSNSSNDLPSRLQLLGGCGVKYRLDNFLFAGGPSVLVTSDSYKSKGLPDTKNSITALVWNLGAEWACSSWLTARIGYKTFTGSVTTQSPASSSTYSELTSTTYGSDDGFTLGLGFKVANFSLDATVNTDVIRQGLNNIGGGGATFAFLSTSYAF